MQRFRGPIDLHAHSSVSDGTQTPAQLVQAAADAGLGTIAITDHDATAGW
jgi:predicted metal-dependent phosphoesterase TrpH